MIAIEAVLPGAEHEIAQQAARLLLREYSDFVQSGRIAQSFLFARLEEEIASLPSLYTKQDGAFFLACLNGAPAGCVAYRLAAGEHKLRSCELKRLYVRPAMRSQGIAKQLVSAALAHAAARGFERAVLDTESSDMHFAHRLYLALGFQEFAHARFGDGVLIYLERTLG